MKTILMSALLALTAFSNVALAEEPITIGTCYLSNDPKLDESDFLIGDVIYQTRNGTPMSHGTRVEHDGMVISLSAVNETKLSIYFQEKSSQFSVLTTVDIKTPGSSLPGILAKLEIANKILYFGCK